MKTNYKSFYLCLLLWTFCSWRNCRLWTSRIFSERQLLRLLTWKAKILEKQTKWTSVNGGRLGTVEWRGRGPRRTSVWKNIPPTSCILCCPLFILPIRLSYEVLSIKNIKASFQKYFIDYSHMSLLPRPWIFCSIPMHNIICFLSDSNSRSV